MEADDTTAESARTTTCTGPPQASLANWVIEGSNCSLSLTPAKGFGASKRSSPLEKSLQAVGRMKVSKVGLLSLPCSPSRTLLQSSSPVSTTTSSSECRIYARCSEQSALNESADTMH